MGIYTYQFSFDEIELDKNEVYKMLRLDRESAPEPYPDIIETEISELRKKFEIQGGYHIVDQVEIFSSSIKVDNTIFDTGKNLASYLKKAEKIALFVCTAGNHVGFRSKKLMGEGQLLEGYITDVIGTVMVESAMDKIHANLTKSMEQLGLSVSNRYSPGYCNWAVNEQHKLFSFFPNNFCGVSLTDSALMQPTKSVSGIIGIGSNIKLIPYLCDNCTNVSCIYRSIK